MTQPWDDLFDAAREAQGRAYAPYSRFRVGAAIRAASGRIHAGCNVENAAYPVGTCAEAGAVAAMLLAGDRAIAEILVFAEGPELCTPCGACRQRLREFGAGTMAIHVAGPEGVRARFTLGELLPHAFGPDTLA
ncbi:cytidine deaminase [Phreatobacter cathodiphilus]|uniref:Cytidine deaminase n=1 Tax=Phreatobacter cathodiphilus TaxID=1868589 RepID=A0A2S0NEV6_9HYPH|nr:cytidine deaminase [Phreatobacter cathodiphilus]AVO46709.1 cytidine deaminase [Phreatobacter cathodiphilus]